MLWDVFISHAREDKAAVARPLQELLEDAGLRVWLDENQLKLGDSLRDKIDEGLAQSRFGIVILSHAFFAKQWPQRELNGLLAREAGGKKAILPIWHNISQAEIADFSPLLADRLAVSTGDGLDTIASEVLKVAGEHLDRTQLSLVGRYKSEFDFPMERLIRAIEVIESLSQAHIWKHLAIVRDSYPHSSWMGTDSPVLIDILFDLMAPLILFRQMEYGFKRSISVFSPQARLQFGLLEAALRLLFNESDLAYMGPPIEYTPRVPDWRTKRQQNPQRYWWQGIERERFDKAVPFFLKSRGDSETDSSLKDIQDFRQTYRSVYRSSDRRNQQAIGLLANALYGFCPQDRPVYWRLWICIARLYQAVLGNTQFDPGQRQSEIGKVFEPVDRQVFPYGFQSTAAGFYETSEVTLRATDQYLRTFALPKLRLYLESPYE